MYSPKWNDVVVWTLLLCLLVIGGLLRIHALGEQSIWLDEGYTLNAAHGILRHGYPLMDSGIVYTPGILHSYLVALSMNLFGETVQVARLVSVLFGILTILVAYALGQRYGNRTMAVGMAAFVAFSYWELAWSRQARMYQQFQFFYLLSLLLFQRFLDRPSVRRFVLVSVGSLFAVLSHGFGLVLLPVFAMMVVISPSTRKSLFTFVQKSKVWLFVGLIIAAVFFVVAFMQLSSFGGTYMEDYLLYLRGAHFVLVAFAFLGIFASLRDLDNGVLPVLGCLVPFALISALVYLLHYRYLFFLLPLLCLLAFHGIQFVADIITSFTMRRFLGALVICLGVVSLLASEQFVLQPQERFRLESMTPQPDFRLAYGFVAAQGLDDAVLVSSEPAIARFYTGRADYWLQYSLTGRGDGSSLLVDDTLQEKYTGATRIKTVEELSLLHATGKGWLVIDTMAAKRIEPSVLSYIRTNLTHFAEGSSNLGYWSGVDVYGWGR